MTCINCSSCGYPHLDLADFARTPHRKHFCGNCGRDSTWSKDPIVSTPLKPLHDEYAKTLKYQTPESRAEPRRLQGLLGQTRVVDETYGEVMLQEKVLERSSLIKAMIGRSTI